MPHLPAVLREAASHQARVTTALRRQARLAIVGFLNALPSRQGLDAAALWREALLLAYRLLFLLKLEGAGDAAGFTTTALWHTALSPAHALGPLARRHLDHGADTGRMLQDGLRLVFRLCRDGLTCAELRLAPLAGGLFAAGATPLTLALVPRLTAVEVLATE